MKPEKLTPKSKNISRWYLDLMELADLADYSYAKGTIIFKPYAYAIWEQIQKILDNWFKQDGVENAYFPLFIPYSLLEKEKTHVKGFSPELAIVTIGGGEKLTEPLVVRPTSETIMYATFSKWLKSYQDLPLKINQWCNVVRWEKRTYPFLRTSEFLWQEGHTAHISNEAAEKMVLKALNWYYKLYTDYLAIDPFIGQKSTAEKFAGADKTFAIETPVENGKSIQSATSHNLGQNFSKAFKIQVLNKDNKLVYVWQTSWGLSTRTLGALFLSHGDDRGLVLPPKIAPYQIVILPLSKSQKIKTKTKQLEKKLAENFRVKTDNNLKKSLGWRLTNWELKGIPVIIEVGEKEVENQELTIKLRTRQDKIKIKQNNYEKEIGQLLDTMQNDLLKQFRNKKNKILQTVNNKDEFIKAINNKKFVKTFWCESEECEAKIKDETKAVSRVVELENLNQNQNKKCFYCGKPAKREWIIARSY
ncbi:MAG: proline--tRNA ligase [Patescibacteria group bacterium]|nr:MAG: proline--tRNA ligase [Patescibacteria group bacterium]